MLLEMALAEFSHERDWNGTSGSPAEGRSPVDSPTHQSYGYERGGRLQWRGGGGYVNLPHSSSTNDNSSDSSSSRSLQVSEDVEEKQLCLEEVTENRLTSSTQEDIAENRTKATLNRARSAPSEQCCREEAAVPFEWEDSPSRRPRMVQESRSFGRSSHPEPVPLPTVLRPISVASPRSVRTVMSPIKGGVGGAVKGIVSPGKSWSNVKESTALLDIRAASDLLERKREELDREMVDSSDDGEATSPVSTLDLPMSPVTPSSYSPQQAVEVVRRPVGKVSQARPTSYWTNTLMSEELPAVMEEDEEDMESIYGYHTMEFQTVDSSPSTSEERRHWRVPGRDASTKSWSAPISRQNSSLRPASENRGRRRSDFDWPEDFEERPEEVVKEVDESLWAFSPVRSSFVFAGNDTADAHSHGPGFSGGYSHGHGFTGGHSQGTELIGNRTPPGSSPILGSVLEHISFKRSLGKSGSKTPPSKSPSNLEYPPRRSSRLRHYSVNGDDDYFSHRERTMKRSNSCLPFFSLCSTQRPTAISFSQRLGPSLSNLNNSTLATPYY